MKKFKETKLHHKLCSEHRKRQGKGPFSYLFITLLATLLLSLASYFVAPLYCYKLCFYIFIAGNIIGGLLFLLTYIRGRENMQLTARRLDAEHNAKNRLESALELVNTKHLLKELQHQDTTLFYAEHKFSHWPMVRLMIIAILLLLLGLNMKILKAQQKRYQAETARLGRVAKEGKQAQTVAAQPPKHHDSAKLKLVMPQAEMRAKPLDEIEWAGVGHSTRGFQKLALAVYLNGKFVKNISAANSPSKQAGNIKIDGFIDLAELNVQPFDLVSYHLTGITRINAHPKQQIISDPQFIEIRPFREDAELAKGENGSGQKKLNLIIHFLRLQLVLNKATFSARIMRQQNDTTQRRKYHNFIRAIQQEQKSLNNEVETFLKSKNAREFPADAINNLEQAQQSLRAAYRELKQ